MRKWILIVLLTGIVSFSHSQGNGYLGKKNLISFFGTGSVRALAIFSGIGDLGSSYTVYDENNRVDFKNKIFRYDARASYAHLLGSKIYLGAEFSYEKIFITNESSGSNSWSSPVLNGYGTLLTLTFNSQDGLAPLGFASTIGLGPRFYKFDVDRNYRFDSQNEMKVVYPDYEKNMIGVNAFWQLSVRKLITRFMVLEFGVRLQTGYVFKNGNLLKNGKTYYEPQFNETYYTDMETWLYYNNDDTPIWSKESLINSLRHENMLNIASFRLGLGFMF